MFALRICALLFFALVVAGNDLKVAYDIMKCAKKAITNGVEEFGIPRHYPYVAVKENITLNGIYLLNNVTLNLSNMALYGVVSWKLSATQLSYDTDPAAVFDFELYWDWLAFKGDFSAEEETFLYDKKQTGDFDIEFSKTSWTGSINVTKPNGIDYGTVNDLEIDWNVKDLNVKLTGLGIFNKVVGKSLATLIKTALNGKLIGNIIGEIIGYRINSVWWDTGKIWDLLKWCQEN